MIGAWNDLIEKNNVSYRGIEGDCLYVLQGFLDAKNRSEKLLIKAIAVKLISFRPVQITFVYLRL